MALAILAACLGAGNAFGQGGVQAILGQAQLQQQGTALVVTTQNGAGTNRSVLNWQSLSVAAGSTLRFDQPNAQSLSINRVIGNDPSSIYGTVSSNGRLVLVNPAGITVGAGAVVDTAGFTASTLRLSEADALAGRLVFGGDGLGGGLLKVDGQILARSGDVVLIAPNVQVGAQALVQAPDGATVLAAGQKVELTGRGLEGITLQLQAPTDQAVNLGTLKGDAVGIFASRLKHTGLIQATAVSTGGGKVVLKAQLMEVSGQLDGAAVDLQSSVTGTGVTGISIADSTFATDSVATPISATLLPFSAPATWTSSSTARGHSASQATQGGTLTLGSGQFTVAGSSVGAPAGVQLIQGQAQLQQQGNTLVVNTQNAAGTNRSVINWQNFSVPAGSATRFDQPKAQSLSTNRVVGNDPSAIFGTLSSNGRPVQVNPAARTRPFAGINVTSLNVHQVLENPARAAVSLGRFDPASAQDAWSRTRGYGWETVPTMTPSLRAKLGGH